MKKGHGMNIGRASAQAVKAPKGAESTKKPKMQKGKDLRCK